MKTGIVLSGIIFCCAALGCAAADGRLEPGLSRKFVGEQLRAFTQEPDGAMVATRDAWINLYYTEGAPFRLSGKVWLGGPSKTLDYPQDLPDGFALFLREWDSLHRYSLTSRSLVAKRRRVEGIKKPKIATLGELGAATNGEWISFSVEATPERISFRFGEQSGEINGPLDMDGANKIALARGTKIKDVQLEILEAEQKPVSSAAVTEPSAPVAAAGEREIQATKMDDGKLALSFRAVPGQTYRLKFKNDLTDLSWTPLGAPVKATDSVVVIRDDTTQPRRFYTVVQEP